MSSPCAPRGPVCLPPGVLVGRVVLRGTVRVPLVDLSYLFLVVLEVLVGLRALVCPVVRRRPFARVILVIRVLRVCLGPLALCFLVVPAFPLVLWLLGLLEGQEVQGCLVVL